MSSLNNYFPHIFCITLPPSAEDIAAGRPNRRLQMEAELAKHNITNVEFIDGIDGRLLNIDPNLKSFDGEPVHKGDIGCVLSHLKVAKLAKERQLPYYLVLEDDAEFCEGFESAFDNAMKPFGFPSMSNNPYILNHFVWDMLYFGGEDKDRNGKPKNVMDNWIQTFATFTTHAIAVHSCMYDALIAELSKQDEKVDVAISNLHKDNVMYSVVPKLVYQRAGWSYILEKDVDYKHLRPKVEE